MNPTKPEQTASPEPAKMSEARRKLIRAGLASGPVVATLASPSVFAAECVAPSQTLSAARSHGAVNANCAPGGLFSSAQWKAALATPTYAAWGAKLFHDVFTQQGTGAAKQLFKSDPITHVATRMTFLEVLQDTDAARSTAREFVAAYLNIQLKGVQFPVGGITSPAASAQAIVSMWNEWASGGYSPNGNANKWTDGQVEFYLKNFVPGP